MKPGQSLARSTRLAQIQHFLLKTPGGLTTRELARLCGVTVRTIQRDLLTLQSDLIVPLSQEGDRYSILTGYILPPVSFSLYEAMSLFLASRLVFRQVDEHNPHMQSALTKMAPVLPPPLAQQLIECVRAMEKKFPNPQYIHIFEQVAIAWSTQRRMKIHYQSLQSQEIRGWLLDPYFVDMSGVGFSTYVIGHAKHGVASLPGYPRPARRELSAHGACEQYAGNDAVDKGLGARCGGRLSFCFKGRIRWLCAQA